MIKWLNSLQPWGILLLRLVFGYSIAQRTYGSAILHGALAHHVHNLANLGVTGWFGSFSVVTEFVCSILLILGLFTRFAAALIAIDLLFALFSVGTFHVFGLYVLAAQQVAVAIMLVLTGGGKLALDKKLGLS